MKRVLVTGCKGYLASNLIKYLKNKKYLVKCIPKNSDKEYIKNLIKKSDVIVHLAAILNPFDNEIFNVNVDYTRFLCDNAKNKKFIYISTQNVLFGKDNYSESKRQAEDIVKTLKSFVMLRPTIIYGKGESRYIGRLINIVKRYPIIPIIGNGKNLLQPVYILDLIKIIEKCINNKVNGTFLVAGSSAITHEELINLLIKKLNLMRLKIFIPIFLLKPFAYIFERLLKNPPITTVQLYNLKINKYYDIRDLENRFKIKLKNIESGLSEVI